MASIKSRVFKGDTDMNNLLRTTPLFFNIADEALDFFSNAAKLKSYPKGKSIYFEEDEAQFFYVVKTGWVKLFHETMDGEEAVVDILTTGHIFGENTIFDNDIYKCNTEAVEDSELLIIPTHILKEQIRLNNNIAFNMLSSMSRHRKIQEQEIEHLTIQNAPQRIGCFLLRLCPRNKETNIIINLPYDKTLLALRLGMKRETFSRAMNTLRDTTNIRINGARVEIDDINQLSDFSCSACSSVYPCEDK